MLRNPTIDTMKYLINTLTTALGAAALLFAFAPTDAAAQCSVRQGSSYGRHYSSPARSHHYRAPARRYNAQRAPVRRVYTSPRVITHPHYGGPIYYRNSSLYVRPTTRYYRAPRTTRSYGYTSRRSYCR